MNNGNEADTRNSTFLSFANLTDGDSVHVLLTLDLVGFTSRKYRDDNSDGERGWVGLLVSFFHKSRKILCEELADYFGRCAPELSPASKDSGEFSRRLRLWKTIGDEAAFCIRVDNVDECFLAAHGLISGAKRLARELGTGTQRDALRIKGAIWMVECGNENVVFDASQSPSPQIDFVGPAVDCGFRLAGKASSNCLVITNEIASMFGDQNFDKLVEQSNIDFRYGGRIALKGVLGGVPYPMYWLPLSPPDEFEKRDLASVAIGTHDLMRMSRCLFEELEGTWMNPPSGAFKVGAKFTLSTVMDSGSSEHKGKAAITKVAPPTVSLRNRDGRPVVPAAAPSQMKNYGTRNSSPLKQERRDDSKRSKPGNKSKSGWTPKSLEAQFERLQSQRSGTIVGIDQADGTMLLEFENGDYAMMRWHGESPKLGGWANEVFYPVESAPHSQVEDYLARVKPN